MAEMPRLLCPAFDSVAELPGRGSEGGGAGLKRTVEAKRNILGHTIWALNAGAVL